MGEIMEISGLGQDDGSTSFIAARVTRGGAPYSGSVIFLNEDGKIIGNATSDKTGTVGIDFRLPKTSSITVAIPGMENTKTAHGLTVSSMAEAKSQDNIVMLDLPGAGINPVASGTMDIIMKWAIPVGLAGILGWIIWRKYQSNIMDGLGWLGIVKPCGPKERKRGRAMRSQRWCLMDRKGKRVLGRHSSRRKAIRQERAIQMRKRK